VPLWLVVVFVVIALLPSVYFLGVQQGEKAATTASTAAASKNTARQASVPLQTAAHAVPAHPAGAPVIKPFSHFRVGNRNVKSILADGDVLWVGTSGGVIRYDIKSDDFRLFDVKNKSLLSNGVFHLRKLGDRLMVGTYGGGLSVFQPETEQWRNYNIPQGLADQFVYDTKVMPNGDLWIATWSGVNLIPGGDMDAADSWQTYNKKNTDGGLPNDWVYGVEADSRGALWFATENGVARYFDGKWQNWQHEHGLGADYEQVKNDLKFSSDPAKVSKHHARQKTEQGFSRVKTAYNPNYVVALLTSDDTVWAGTWGGGLAHFDGKTWRNYTSADGLPSNHVFTLYEDPQKRFWIGTSHGLARLENEKFVVYRRQQGLFADNVFSLTTDEQGYLWAGSFGGVARLDLSK